MFISCPLVATKQAVYIWMADERMIFTVADTQQDTPKTVSVNPEDAVDPNLVFPFPTFCTAQEIVLSG